MTPGKAPGKSAKKAAASKAATPVRKQAVPRKRATSKSTASKSTASKSTASKSTVTKSRVRQSAPRSGKIKGHLPPAVGKEVALQTGEGTLRFTTIAPETVLVQGDRVGVVPFRTEALIDWVGSVTGVAELLGVDKSQPSRWRKGEALPSPQAARLLTDLEHVYSRAAMIFTSSVINSWMTGPNDYLEGARPIDVLKTRGVSEVLNALDAAEQIAFGG